MPNLLAFAGTPRNAERARWFGFLPTGTTYAGTDLSLIEFAPPGRDGVRLRYERALKYYLMAVLVRSYKDSEHIDPD